MGTSRFLFLKMNIVFMWIIKTNLGFWYCELALL